MSYRLSAALDFLGAAGALKDQYRSGFTQAGDPESVPAHTWRLALLAVVLADEFEGIDLARLLSLIVVHDLGETIHGDVPAIGRAPGFDKTAQERADMATLTEALPDDMRARILDLWEEYEAAETPEAVIAKGLDKCETMLTHAEGKNPEDFDYAWNLGYGNAATDAHPMVKAVRVLVDERTRGRMG